MVFAYTIGKHRFRINESSCRFEYDLFIKNHEFTVEILLEDPKTYMIIHEI